jgi:hypothetical protein
MDSRALMVSMFCCDDVQFRPKKATADEYNKREKYY